MRRAIACLLILSLATAGCAPREETQQELFVSAPLDMAAYRQQLAERYPPDDVDRWCAWSVEVPQVDICATRLRADIAAGKDVVGLLKPAVLAYIREHGLYRDGC